MSDARLIARCDNWGSVLRYRIANVGVEGSGRGRVYCAKIGSYEAAYRSPQRNHWSEPVTAAANALDTFDADDVESAVCTLEMYPHAILRGWHVNRLSEPMCLRLAAKAAGESRGKLRGWDATLAMAYALLADALTSPRVLRRLRARERVAMVLGAS